MQIEDVILLAISQFVRHKYIEVTDQMIKIINIISNSVDIQYNTR